MKLLTSVSTGNGSCNKAWNHLLLWCHRGSEVNQIQRTDGRWIKSYKRNTTAHGPSMAANCSQSNPHNIYNRRNAVMYDIEERQWLHELICHTERRECYHDSNTTTVSELLAPFAPWHSLVPCTSVTSSHAQHFSCTFCHMCAWSAPRRLWWGPVTAFYLSRICLRGKEHQSINFGAKHFQCNNEWRSM